MAEKIEISHRTIIFTVLFLLSLWLLYQVKDIILSLFVAFIIMAALNPTVERMEKLKIPRAAAIIVFYIVFFGFFGVMVAAMVPPLVDQTAVLFGKVPEYVKQINLPWLDSSAISSQFSKFGSIPENLIKVTVGIFMNVINIFTLAVITFYFLMERKKLAKYVSVLFSDGSRQKAIDFMERLEIRMGKWVRAEVVLMVIIGTMTYVGLRILGIEFCLPLAMMAGFLEVVPNIGPTIAAIPAVIAGLTISPLHGLAVLVLYIFIQQIENGLIVPKVMAKGLGINPLVVIISLAVGLKLGGVLGMILGVPVFLLAQEVLAEVNSSNRFPKV